ncbi:hypothetical protein EH221_03665 [bacterium]|nr:MAG: hypothetical protein EH221_03665 [bacterium]
MKTSRTITLSEKTQQEILSFLHTNDLIQFYREYDWDQDNWKTGFKKILNLEEQTSLAAKNNVVGYEHVMAIAKWGAHRNLGKIQCATPINLPIYTNNQPVSWIESDPTRPLTILRPQIKYYGPTYFSKLLRFSMPAEYGAIDSRLVRVFGEGDPICQKARFLSLKVVFDSRWSIPEKQSGWPGEYGTWTNILRFMTKFLNESQIKCPHPDAYYQKGLREPGIWMNADVEMALFSYVSQVIYGKSRCA